MSNLLDDKPFNTIGDVEASAAKQTFQVDEDFQRSSP